MTNYEMYTKEELIEEIKNLEFTIDCMKTLSDTYKMLYEIMKDEVTMIKRKLERKDDQNESNI